ncbi:MAG TPA: GNAT family N-acetyltransferase [Actinomycetota bacterium]|nr:GNAT family N-acetyltransferase [Actinomycetota bacterium]
MNDALLRRIDAYLDAVPRAVARVEAIGPFTLFVTEGPGWPYYARPKRGATTFAARDVLAVRARQRELGVPEALEWVVELTPGVGEAARAAGLQVVDHPLMHLPAAGLRAQDPPAGARLDLVSSEADVAAAQAVAAVAFSNPGTQVSPAGHDAVVQTAATLTPATVRAAVDRIARGLTVTAVAVVEGRPVAVGSHQPVEGATEIVGVGTVPAFRCRGLGAAVTSMLVRDAIARGVRTIFLSAGDDPIARVYAGLGFLRIGTAGAADPA